MISAFKWSRRSCKGGELPLIDRGIKGGEGKDLEWIWTCVPWMVMDDGRQAVDIPADDFEGHGACVEFSG
jgi:hypothetical protein